MRTLLIAAVAVMLLTGWALVVYGAVGRMGYEQSAAAGAAVVALLVLFGFFGPGFGIEALDVWPDTSDGAVVTVTETEYQSSSGETLGGDVFVAILDSLSAAVGEMFMILCGGGLVTWIAILVVVFLGIAGIGSLS